MFCIITPVFDGCAESTNLLIQDLQRQTYTNFQQILISNGSSPKIKELLKKVNENRVVYKEHQPEDTSTAPRLIENLGKRRNYCLKSFQAERFFFFDADLMIIDDEFFEKIHDINNKADIILSKIKVGEQEYPRHPIQKGNIDIANYSISKKLATKYNYPTQYDTKNDIAFDWRFYNLIKNEGNYFSDILYAHKNGHNNYKTVCAIYTEWMTSNRPSN